MNRIAGILFVTFLFVVILLLTAWGTLAIYYSQPGGAVVGAILACGYLLAGAAALGGVVVARWRKSALTVLAVLTAVLLIGWSGIEPSNDRNWKPEVALAPYADIDGDRVTMHNIRNFDYHTETDFTAAYYDKTFDLRNLEGFDVVASYWMGPHIAHIFVSFDFGADGHLAVSIERRDEVGESYSTVRGLFRQYELFYVVADERDLIRLRTNVRADPPEDVYLYRVNGQLEGLRRLFLEYLHKINSLKEQPEFYNTLLTNCTTNIWMHTRVNASHPALSWKLLASGYVPEYLYELGRLDTTLPFPELQAQSRINDRARAPGGDADYSRRIREGLPGMSP